MRQSSQKFFYISVRQSERKKYAKLIQASSTFPKNWKGVSLPYCVGLRPQPSCLDRLPKCETLVLTSKYIHQKIQLIHLIRKQRNISISKKALLAIKMISRQRLPREYWQHSMLPFKGMEIHMCMLFLILLRIILSACILFRLLQVSNLKYLIFQMVFQREIPNHMSF